MLDHADIITWQLSFVPCVPTMQLAGSADARWSPVSRISTLIARNLNHRKPSGIGKEINTRNITIWVQRNWRRVRVEIAVLFVAILTVLNIITMRSSMRFSKDLRKLFSKMHVKKKGSQFALCFKVSRYTLSYPTPYQNHQTLHIGQH